MTGARQQAEERRLTMMCVGGARERSSWKTRRFKAPSQVAKRVGEVEVSQPATPTGMGRKMKKVNYYEGEQKMDCQTPPHTPCLYYATASEPP
jgi:hypothetical protein